MGHVHSIQKIVIVPVAINYQFDNTTSIVSIDVAEVDLLSLLRECILPTRLFIGHSAEGDSIECLPLPWSIKLAAGYVNVLMSDQIYLNSATMYGERFSTDYLSSVLLIDLDVIIH